MILSVILLFTNCKISGRYVYKPGGFSESFTFNSDNTFDSYWGNDVGTSKRFGTYEVKRKKVILTYTNPPIENNPGFSVDTLDYIEPPVPIFPNYFQVNHNFINISVIDKTTNRPLHGGHISYFYDGHISIYYGGGTFPAMGPFPIRIDKLDFPLTVKLDFLGYFTHEFVLTEKTGYDITVAVVSKQGYHPTTGQNIFKKRQFKNRKRKKRLTPEDLTRQKFYRDWSSRYLP